MRIWPLLLLFSVGCTPVAERELVLDECRDVRLSGALQVTVTPEGNPALNLLGEQTQLDAVQFETSAGTVRLTGQDVAVDLSCSTLRNLELIGAVQAELAPGLSRLERLAAYGTSQVASSRLSVSDLDLRASGQAAVSVAALEAEALALLAGGDSQVVVAGSAQTLMLNAGGRSRVDAGALRVQTVNVDVASSAAVHVWATAHLQGRARDLSQVIYRGAPDLSMDTADSASVERAD